MIITTITESSYVKCDRCKKTFEIKPFHYGYAPMCDKCHTFQKLCPDCIEKGCIVCHAPIPRVMY